MELARGAGAPVVAEPAVLRRMLAFGLFGVAAMTVLAPGIALMRGTTGHDWYAAGKLTAVNTAIAVGFDRNAPVVRYRRWNGRVERMSRDDMYWNGEALAARAHSGNRAAPRPAGRRHRRGSVADGHARRYGPPAPRPA